MTTIKLKRSSIQGKVPTTEQLALGELAINTTDIALYTKDTSGNVIALNDWNNLLNKPDLTSLPSTASVFFGTTAPEIDEYEFWFHIGNGRLYVGQPATSDNAAGWTVVYSGSRGTSNVPVGNSLVVSERLIADRTYYVSPHGNDRNDGLTPATPFRTIMMAMSAVQKLDASSFSVTVQLLKGTYLEEVNLPVVVGATSGSVCSLRGNLQNATDVLIKSPSPAITNSGNTLWKVEALTVESTAGSGIVARRGGKIELSQVRIGQCAGNHQLQAASEGRIYITNNCDFYGGGFSCLFSNANGAIVISPGVTLTFYANPVYNTVVACYNGAYIEAASVTLTGTATGYRYVASGNSCIYTGTGNATYFPGSLSGAATNGSQYF